MDSTAAVKKMERYHAGRWPWLSQSKKHSKVEPYMREVHKAQPARRFLKCRVPDFNPALVELAPYWSRLS